MSELTKIITRKWINIKETLPMFNEDVLVTDNKRLDIGYYIKSSELHNYSECDFQHWVTRQRILNSNNITHWMPLPNIPKEEFKNE